MRIQDKLGWICLLISFVFYYVDGYGTSQIGLFLNSMALGFFGSSVFMQYKEWKNRRNNGR